MKEVKVEDIDNTLDFCNEITGWEMQNEFKIIDDFLDSKGFLDGFLEVYNREKSKLPYHINLIDELGANENAHSRIFKRLLEAKENDDYYILKSFLNYLKPPFSELYLSGVKVTCGTDYIDIRVRAKEFSLIIENKIHGASDQEEQIIRYVKNEERENYSGNSNIYVLYLTRRNEEEKPDNNSLPLNLETELGNRYKSISYRNTILPWLETEVIPNCGLKDSFLISAIQQYIDHLNGMFHFRKIDKNMNEELKKHLLEKLNLEGEEINKQIEILKTKKEEVGMISGYIDDLITEKRIIWLKSIQEQMKIDFLEYTPELDIESDKDYPKSYITLSIADCPVSVGIEIDNDRNDLYYGIFIQNYSEKYKKVTKIITENIEKLSLKKKNLQPEDDEFYCWNCLPENLIYAQFKVFCKKVIELSSKY